MTYTRLEVPMREAMCVHELDTLNHLVRDLSCLSLGKASAEVSLEVSVRDVLHGNEELPVSREPA